MDINKALKKGREINLRRDREEILHGWNEATRFFKLDPFTPCMPAVLSFHSLKSPFETAMGR
jgi:hypothetical protein